MNNQSSKPKQSWVKPSLERLEIQMTLSSDVPGTSETRVGTVFSGGLAFS